MDRCRYRVEYVGLLDGKRESDVSGPKPPRNRPSKRFPDNPGEFPATCRCSGPGGDGSEQGTLVQLVESPALPLPDIKILSDVDQRQLRLVGFRKPRENKERSTPAGTLADPHLTAETGIGVRHKRGGTLIPGKDVTDRMLESGEGLIERETGVSAKAEKGVHPCLVKHPDQSPVSFHGFETFLFPEFPLVR